MHRHIARETGQQRLLRAVSRTARMQRCPSAGSGQAWHEPEETCGVGKTFEASEQRNPSRKWHLRRALRKETESVEHDRRHLPPLPHWKKGGQMPALRMIRASCESAVGRQFAVAVRRQSSRTGSAIGPGTADLFRGRCHERDTRWPATRPGVTGRSMISAPQCESVAPMTCPPRPATLRPAHWSTHA